MCLFHVSFQNRSGSDHVPAHDEFSSARKVSPLNRAMRMSGFIRLRRTAAAGAIGICALCLIAAASACAAADSSTRADDARSAERLISLSEEEGEGKAELGVTGGSWSQDAALAAAEARVPKKAVLGESATLAIKSVRREDGAGQRRVIVDVAAPAGARVTLFAEGPTPDWALPVPKAVDGAPAGLQRFAFALEGAPPGVTYEGIPVALTAVAGNIAIEVMTRLD